MKVVLRRGRIDPAVSPTQTAAPLLPSQIVSEEELNSEVELLRDESVLREVVTNTGLARERSWLSFLGANDPERDTENAVRKLAKHLDVRPVHKSQIIAVSYTSPDPRLAASVLKSVEDVYLAQQKQVGRPSGQQAFFEEQVKVAQRELQGARSELERFGKDKRVVSATMERDLALQKLSESQASEFELAASLAEALAKTQALDDKLRQLPPRRVSQVRNADNQQLQEKLKSKLLELQLRRTTLLTTFQPSYRLVQEVDQQISQAKAALEAENLTPLRDELTEDNPDYAWADSERVKTSVMLAALRRRLSAAREQVAAYQSRAQSLGRDALSQSDLEQRLKSAEDKYLLYAGKREEARIGDALDQSGILNVTIAQPPHVPALPARSFWLSAALSLAAGFVLSTGAVIMADRVDPSIRTPRDIAELLGTPVLASLPAPPAHGSSRLRVI
jgi:polysaccharide biosynthesis transport protein